MEATAICHSFCQFPMKQPTALVSPSKDKGWQGSSMKCAEPGDTGKRGWGGP